MHSLLAALNRGEAFRPGTAHKSTDFNVGGDFAAFFNRSIARVSGGETLNGGVGVENLLSRLRERFPAAKIAERDVPPGLEESKAAAGDDGDKTSDKVNLSSPLLEKMGLDAGLAGKIEDMLAGLFSGDKASPPGGYVQRSVSVTVTTVRYTELLRTDAEGSVIAAGELQTALREKIDEMLADLSGALEKAFGSLGREGGRAEGKGEADGDGDGGKRDALARKQPGGAFAGLWSLELFYSTATVQSTTRNGGASGELAWDGASFTGGYASFGGLMGGGLTGGGLPSFLSRLAEGNSQTANGAAGSGFLDRALAGTGVSLSGYRQVEAGFSLKFTQSRDLIGELMELYGERLGGRRKNAASEESGAADEAATAARTAVEETEEEAVAV